jgi:glycosyltransferase involved in cell wall biosynthesis
VGVEKNLTQLAEAYRKLRETRKDAHLIIVGDGPYRQKMEELLAGLPVTFTGFLEGEDLPRAIASADAKLFPSTTDTWGNAPLEAQSSGLPVVVSDVGGPCELMEDGVTGIKIPGRDVEALYEAMITLMDPKVRARMGENARAFVEANRVDEPFLAVLDSEAYRRQLQKARHEPGRPGMWAQRHIDLEALHKENGSGPSPYFPGDGWTGEVVNA